MINMLYDAVPQEPITALPTTSLQLRKTHQYVGSWQHEDKWDHLGTVSTLQYSSICTDAEDPCEPTRIMKLVKVSLDQRDHSKPLWTDAQIKQALRDTFTRSGCSHEHDCCGCWSHHVSEVLPLARRTGEYVLIMHASRNY